MGYRKGGTALRELVITTGHNQYLHVNPNTDLIMTTSRVCQLAPSTATYELLCRPSKAHAQVGGAGWTSVFMHLTGYATHCAVASRLQHNAVHDPLRYITMVDSLS